jgi:glutamine synthetase
MVRVQGASGDPSSHIENRLGEPAANPYLYLASNIAAGLDGIRRELTPPDPVEADPYSADAPLLPVTLDAAVEALSSDRFYRGVFGATFVDYLVTMKRAELKRYHAASAGDEAEVTDWEMREYFEFY